MIIFPCAKINLGLNVVSRRNDGLHDIETVFLPIPLTDALEIKCMDEQFPVEDACNLTISGISVFGNGEDNLVVKAYHLLAKDFELPRIYAYLHKRIPVQAGMGGGSSDAAYMIRLLNERFSLNMKQKEMEAYAGRLGADCAFFIASEPAFASGTGNILEPFNGLSEHLKGYYLTIVKPDIAVSTREAYSFITPKRPAKCCKDIVAKPVETWREELTNDFEAPIFSNYPAIAAIKEQLYSLGASFALMSGSGSAVFALFKERPVHIEQTFGHYYTAVIQL